MRTLIETEKDLQFLQGKFVLQINNDTPDKMLMDMDWGFAKTKRLYLVCGIGFADLCGGISKYETFEEFKNIFNNYLFKHMIKNGETNGGRFYRLLTTKEIKYLATKLIEENY